MGTYTMDARNTHGTLDPVEFVLRGEGNIGLYIMYTKHFLSLYFIVLHRRAAARRGT